MADFPHPLSPATSQTNPAAGDAARAKHAVLPRRQGGSSWLRDSGVWAIVAAGILLWLAGYPRPHIDDLFYAGTGIHLAQTGELANPWIARWLSSFNTDRFWVQPPMLPYSLALWLKVFGVSTASLTAFHLAMQTGLGVILYRMARRNGAGPASGLALAGVAFIYLLNLGMRPEALAFFLLAAGHLGFSRGDRAGFFFAALLVSAAVLAHPLVGTVAVPLHAWRCWRWWRDGRSLAPVFVATVAGIVAAFATFLVIIGGHLAPFLDVFSAYARMFRPHAAQAPFSFWGELTLGRETVLSASIFLLAVASVARVWRRPANTPTAARGLWAVWMVAVAIGVFLYPTRMAHYAGALALLLGVVSWQGTRAARPVALATIVLALAAHAGFLLVPLFGPGDRPDAAAIRQIASDHPRKTLCVDEVVMRYVYDFRPPAGTLDWTQRQPADLGCFGTLANKPADELWLVNEWRLEHSIADTTVRAERLHVGPFTFGSIAAAPYRVAVVP